MRVLVVEDNPQVSSYLQKSLREVGGVVDCASDGRVGLMMAASEDYDVLIIDRMLPKLDGLAVVRTLRASDDHTPALILSALGEVDQRVEGLRAGGDDYLVKPFAFSELHARLEALLRRKSTDAPETCLRVADLEMDLLSRRIVRAGREIDLQPQEFRLLEYMMRHAGQVLTRTMLLESVWDFHFDPQTNVIEVHISRLRAKIDRDFDLKLIHTRRGAGYILSENG
jgi:two-component system OmpR family response regulator